MKLSLRHLVSVGTLAGLVVVPSLAFAQGKDPQPQPQPTEPQPQPQPQPQPAGTGATESGPTITLGTNPSKDTTQKEEAKAEEKEEQKLPWAGTALTSQLSMSTTSFARQQQLTPTDLVESWFLFTPRWQLHKNWVVRGRFTLTYEWTDTAASSTTTRNEPLFGDSIAYLDFQGIPEVPKLGIKSKVTATVAFPTSKASWNRTQIFSPGIGGSISKTFEKVGKGVVSMSAGATWSHPIYQYTTPGQSNPLPYSPSCYLSPGSDSGACGGQVAGSANPENVIAALFTLGGEWPLGKGTFKPSAFMFWINTWDYRFKDLTGLTDNGHATVNCDANGNCSVPAFKQSTFFNVAIDYDFWGPMKWLGVEAGYYLFRPLFDGNGRIGNPFFDTMQDMRVYIAANIAFDDLYLTVAGKKTKEEAPPGAKGRGVTKAIPGFTFR